MELDHEHCPKRINVEWVNRRVEEIRRICEEPMFNDDYEKMARGLEDRLYTFVLTYISGGNCDEPEACAKAALQTRMFNFLR